VIRCLLIVILMSLTSAAWSEGMCPPGMYQAVGRDYIGCAPIPGYNQGGNQAQSSEPIPPPAPIPMVWETRWGAIATENNGSGFGAVTGVETKQEAERQAFSQCKASATTPKAECKVILPYSDQCVALAWGAGGGSRVNSAVDLATAEAHALGNCNKYSQSGCQIYYSDCSFAEAVPPSHK
jgi:Domain of unknown function (DUF4189)